MPRPFKEKGQSEKIEEKATFPNSFYDARIALIPKSDKDTSNLQTNIPYEYGCKTLEILAIGISPKKTYKHG